jgi:hypothetical protein
MPAATRSIYDERSVFRNVAHEADDACPTPAHRGLQGAVGSDDQAAKTRNSLST